LPHFGPEQTEEAKTAIRAPFMEGFLVAFREFGSQYPACKAVNISSKAVQRWIRDNVDGFRDRYQEAQQAINDTIEAEIRRRSVEGWLEPVFQGGKQVGTIRKFSDQLLMFYAKARMPEKYRDKFEGANLIAGDVNMVRNETLGMIAGYTEEELERLAGRGRNGDGIKALGDGKAESDQTDAAEGPHDPGDAQIVEGEAEVVDTG
jgi:hypothetical protein